MNEIVERLYVGDYQDAKTFTESPTPNSISINVAFEHALSLPNSVFMPYFVPLPTGGGMIVRITLDAVTELIAYYLAQGARVLVNCNAGMERSPLAVAWFLYKKKQMTFEAAYELVKSKRPQTVFHPEWVKPFFG